MTKGRIALQVVLVAFLLVVLKNQLIDWGYLPDKVPVTKCIGLKPVLDKKQEGVREVVRNLVYRNDLLDPLFYTKIVHKIEECDWISSQNLTRREDIDGDRFSLDGSPYRNDALREKTAFISNDRRFQCVVYNGGDFVLVVLSAWY